jgi:hypothetical protein
MKSLIVRRPIVNVLLCVDVTTPNADSSQGQGSKFSPTATAKGKPAIEGDTWLTVMNDTLYSTAACHVYLKCLCKSQCVYVAVHARNASCGEVDTLVRPTVTTAVAGLRSSALAEDVAVLSLKPPAVTSVRRSGSFSDTVGRPSSRHGNECVCFMYV